MAEDLPTWARNEVDAICRKFFWAGNDTSVKGKCMVSWPIVCKPTTLGGLGVSDLKLTGYALQTDGYGCKRLTWTGLSCQSRLRLKFRRSSGRPRSWRSEVSTRLSSGKTVGSMERR
ncbi:uncharacterized protein [Miscanthus floridulus]|uniref:uncharacterized protein n=1 Tax=Miscanthus floridulus TaxID=154761 RepID=UPI0034577061